MDVSELAATLGLFPPPFRTAEEAFWQLSNVAKAASHSEAQSIAIERHYIDRDHIEDHSAFYAKSLHQYDNSCQRVHFFKLPEAELRKQLAHLAEGARTNPDTYRNSCADFSAAHYLGFSVIKPLRGSPVGRTILAAPAGLACARRYQAHLLGVELTVYGVPFQQQDVGVSACATTALWSSLRVLGSLEPIAPATPAEITNLAVKYYLPLGRAMPQSEGLNIGQMCQAVEALGVSPLLLRPLDPEDTLGLLYSVLRSRLVPVLLITEDQAGPHGSSSHAVAATGFVTEEGPPVMVTGGSIADPAMNLKSVFLHDDRIGPYAKSTLEIRRPLNQLLVHIPGGKPDPQTWRIDHILVPIHTKVRLSFAGLRRLALTLAGHASVEVANASGLLPGEGADPPISFEAWIWRTHKYIEDLLRKTATPIRAVSDLSSKALLPRYLGIVRLQAPFISPIDVLIDTTSTNWNLHVIGVVPLAPAGGLTTAVAAALAEWLSRPEDAVPLFTTL